MNDLKFAFRQLLKHPGFTTVAVLTLALGIGINLMLFAFFNVLLFRPRPVRAPYELWAIRPANGNGQPLDYGVNLCRPYYDEIRRNNRLFDGIIGYATVTPKFRTQDGAEMVTASLVSGEYFNFLGVVPAQGRAFSAEDDKPGASRVAVLSHRFWQQFLNGDQKVIGRAISLNDQAVEVIGVMPAGFLDLGRAPPDLWLRTS